MLFAAEKTRPVLWHMSTGLEVLWYFLAVVSVLVFAYGVWRPIAKYRRGRAIWMPARSELWPRFKRATRRLFAHSAIARRDPLAGWAHRGTFYGFLVLFAGTIILAIDTDVVHRISGYSYFKGNFYLGYSVVLDVFGLALVGGLAVMMVRRGILRPRKLDYARPDRAPGEEQFDRRVYRVGDWVFLGVLITIALTGYLLEGVRVAEDNPGYNAWTPIGWVFAQLYDGLGVSQSGLTDIRHGIWWFHGLLAISFVAAIPYTKATHMLTSYASMVLKDPLAGKRLRPIPEELASEPAGYATLADFSITHLLQLDACTKCGRCHEVCPANITGRPLSPRDVILELREQANAGIDHPAWGEHSVHADTAWSCMQCNACVEICPVGIEQAPIINQLRRNMIEEGELDSNLQSTLQVIHKSGNSFGENRRRRGRWTEELEFEVKDARTEPVDLLWFVGDYASFDPRSQTVTRALATILHEAGVDFGIMFDGERNAGNDVRRVGEEGLFEALAEHNVAALSECEFARILTSDPHSLNTLRNEYPDYGGEWEVVHHTALLLELIQAGRLAVDGQLSYRVTYHDPCYLGRHNGGYDAPREILRRLGCELIEMPRNRDNSFCCGAGGGRIWIPDKPGAQRPSENRIREAVSVGPLDLFVVSCPKDVTMFEDAIKTSGNADNIRLAELTELVQEALVAAPVAAV